MYLGGDLDKSIFHHAAGFGTALKVVGAKPVRYRLSAVRLDHAAVLASLSLAGLPRLFP